MATKKGKHKRLDPHVRRSVDWLESLEPVKRIILGFTEVCRHSFAPGHLRCRQDVVGGFNLNGYGGMGIVDIFVGVDDDDRDAVKELIEAKFPN